MYIIQLIGNSISFILRKVINYSCHSITICGIEEYSVGTLVSTIHILINTCKHPYGTEVYKLQAKITVGFPKLSNLVKYSWHDYRFI